MLGNVVTNTASGTVSPLSEPRAVVLTRFIVLGLHAHRPRIVSNTGVARPTELVQTRAAQLHTSVLACVVLNTIASYNPRAFYDALSRSEVEDALKELFRVLVRQQALQADDNNSTVNDSRSQTSTGQHVRLEILLQYVRVVAHSLRCCLRLHNSNPHLCYDPFWTYSIQTFVQRQADLQSIGSVVRHRLLQPVERVGVNNRKEYSWVAIDLVGGLIDRFAGPLLDCYQSIAIHNNNGGINSISAETTAGVVGGSEAGGGGAGSTKLLITNNLLKHLACCTDAFGIAFLLLADIVSAAAVESMLRHLALPSAGEPASSSDGAANVDSSTSVSPPTSSSLISPRFRTASVPLIPELAQMIDRILNQYGNLFTCVVQFAFSLIHEKKVAVAATKVEEIQAKESDSADPADAESSSNTTLPPPPPSSSPLDMCPLLCPALAALAALLDCAYDRVLESLTVERDGLILAVLRASYLCPDSRSLHAHGLSILASVASHGGGLFAVGAGSLGTGLPAGGRSKKRSTRGVRAVNEDTLLNQGSVQAKPRAKKGVFAKDEASSGASSSEAVETTARMVQCAHFVLAAATLCEHTPVFYRNFGVVLKTLATSAEASREVMESYCFLHGFLRYFTHEPLLADYCVVWSSQDALSHFAWPDEANPRTLATDQE